MDWNVGLIFASTSAAMLGSQMGMNCSIKYGALSKGTSMALYDTINAVAVRCMRTNETANRVKHTKLSGALNPSLQRDD